MLDSVVVLAGRFRAAIEVFPAEPFPPARPIRRAEGAALSARGGPYAVWVLGGCAALQPVTRDYLRAGRAVDAAFLRRAVDAYDDLYARWRRGTPSAPSGTGGAVVEPVPHSRLSTASLPGSRPL